MLSRTVTFLLLWLGVCAFFAASARPTEDERVAAWYARNNTWPPNWNPKASEHFKYAMSVRDRELQLIPGRNERWENYVQYTQSLMVPWFTPLGFKVIQIPPQIFAKLNEKVTAGVANWDNLREERQIDAVYTPLPSKFVDMHGVNTEVHEALKELHEEWIGGVKLMPTSAYGVRLYQNGSSLVMHHDKVCGLFPSCLAHCLLCRYYYM
jgi:hypothetical protein